MLILICSYEMIDLDMACWTGMILVTSNVRLSYEDSVNVFIYAKHCQCLTKRIIFCLDARWHLRV